MEIHILFITELRVGEVYEKFVGTPVSHSGTAACSISSDPPPVKTSADLE